MQAFIPTDSAAPAAGDDRQARISRGSRTRGASATRAGTESRMAADSLALATRAVQVALDRRDSGGAGALAADKVLLWLLVP
jgi:hypothetical protein